MLRNMFSTTAPTSSAALSKTDTAGWKWEVNHDGVVWSWYHPCPSLVSVSAPSGLVPSSSSSVPSSSAPSGLVPSGLAPLERTTLVDYWYIVNDGVVIPHVNDW